MAETKTTAAKTAAKKTTTAKTTTAGTAKKASSTTTKATKTTATKKVEAEKVVTAPVAEVKAEVKTAPKAKKAEKQLKITLVKSGSGRLEKQTRTLEALGLRKTNSTTIKPDNACTRGMIFVVKHLVKVEEI